jgi:integrase
VHEILPTFKLSNQPPVRSQLRKHLCFFNNFALREINLALVQSFVASRTCKPKTTENLVDTLRSIWGTARKQGYVSHDVFDGLVLPTVVKPEERFYTEDEMVRIIYGANEPEQTFYWLAAETGMRAGELCGVRWQDIRDGYVVVCRSTWRGKATTTKSGKKREFAISEQLQARLASMHDGSADLSSLIFQTRNGTAWDPNMVVKRKLHPLLDRLGIERAGLHAFRHGNETAMDRWRTPIAVRLSRLGHADTRMMVNYSHVVSADDRAVAQQFGSLFAPKEEQQERVM